MLRIHLISIVTIKTSRPLNREDTDTCNSNYYILFHDALISGFYGTYLVYGHQDVLLGPYSDKTFRIKDVMYKGLLPAMGEDKMAAECDKLVEKIAEKGDTDFQLSDLVGKVMSDVYSTMVILNASTLYLFHIGLTVLLSCTFGDCDGIGVLNSRTSFDVFHFKSTLYGRRHDKTTLGAFFYRTLFLFYQNFKSFLG